MQPVVHRNKYEVGKTQEHHITCKEKGQDLSGIRRKKRSVAIMYKDSETPNSLIYSLIMPKFDKSNQEHWSKQRVQVALAFFGVPA